jgi:hypothetical protein
MDIERMTGPDLLDHRLLALLVDAERARDFGEKS